MVWKFMPFILFTVITNAAAQILLKKGMTHVGSLSLGTEPAFATMTRVLFNPFVFIGLSTYVFGIASHMYVLTKVDVSVAYPFLSLAYVLVAIWAAMFLNETMTTNQIIGVGAILVGILLITIK